MLNSFQLEDLLVADGWILVPEYNLTHAHGYRHPTASHVLYVKSNAKHPNRSKAVDKNPLFLHPDLRALLVEKSIPGVSIDPEDRFNDNAAAFPRRVNPNKRPSAKYQDKEAHFGVAVGVADSSALAALAHLLNSGPASADAAACTAPDEFLRRAAELEFVDRDLPATTRRALVDARIGQGQYREQMLDIWRQRCAVTGCALCSVLVASHALAWNEGSDAARLDPYNGLPLTASIDKLFDQGLISFADDGRLLRKPGLSDADLANLGLRPGARLRAECMHPRHLPYLAAHRTKWKF